MTCVNPTGNQHVKCFKWEIETTCMSWKLCDCLHHWPTSILLSYLFIPAREDAEIEDSAKRFFFPSNAFMASARSFNTFNCMLQIVLQKLISAYKGPSAVGRHKEWTGEGPLCSPVGRHEVTTKQQKANNQKTELRTQNKKTENTANPKTQNKQAKQRRDRCQFMG